MATALTTSDMVIKRLGDLDLTAGELGMIEEYIEDASDAARDYGNPTWNSSTVPTAVARLVASAVAAFMRNPDRLSQSRASDETMGYQDSREYDWFTEPEIARLGRMAKPALPAFGSVQMVAYGHKAEPTVGYATWGTDTMPFPLDAVDGGW